MSETTLTRMRDRAITERAELDRLLDDTFLAHVGMTDGNGGAVVIPTAIARDGDRLLVHGSTGSGWMRRAAAGRPVCVAVTDLSGIIIARSSFESSFRYRSAVLFGSFTRLSGPDVPHALDVITERFLPGRLAEIRGTYRRELAATMVLSMPILDWSMKISGGWPTDPADDVAGGAWAGLVPFHAQVGDPEPAPDLRAGIPVPASVRAMTLRCPQRRGPVGQERDKEPASRQ
jgi:nitroimidazol reductase NimA-like FMN-containing flavoprotein (pyridoxamine 5'-phosphate oxidase superfamily)